MKLEQLFRVLGLKEGEVKVMGALLSEGALSPTEISRLTAVNRVSTYEYLRSLSEKGVITKTIKGRREMYILTHPQSLKRMVTRQKEALEQHEIMLDGMYADLVNRYETKSGRPRVIWYEGISGIQDMLLDYVENNISGKVVGFSNTYLVEQVFPLGFLRKFIKKKIKNQITSSYIIAEPREANLEKYLRKYYRNVPQRILPKCKVLRDNNERFFETEINAYDDKVSFIKIKPPAYFGVLIKNLELAGSLKLIFDSLWKTL